MLNKDMYTRQQNAFSLFTKQSQNNLCTGYTDKSWTNLSQILGKIAENNTSEHIGWLLS